MPEVPLENAHETIEHHAHGSSEPWVLGVALTAALLAALAAVTALYAEHNANEAMLERIKASDLWTQYQAKSIKEGQLQTQIALKKLLGKAADADESSKLAEYEKDKSAIFGEAKKLEEESERHVNEHAPLSRGLTMFQVAIAIAAISVVTKRKAFWLVSLAFGAVGLGFFVWGIAI